MKRNNEKRRFITQRDTTRFEQVEAPLSHRPRSASDQKIDTLSPRPGEHDSPRVGSQQDWKGTCSPSVVLLRWDNVSLFPLREPHIIIDQLLPALRGSSAATRVRPQRAGSVAGWQHRHLTIPPTSANHLESSAGCRAKRPPDAREAASGHGCPRYAVRDHRSSA